MPTVRFILARADLDDDRVTHFVDAMRAAAGDLAAALPQAAFSTIENTVASAPSRDWLHRVVSERG